MVIAGNVYSLIGLNLASFRVGNRFASLRTCGTLLGPNIAKVSLLFVREIDVRVCANIIIFVSVYVNIYYLAAPFS